MSIQFFICLKLYRRDLECPLIEGEFHPFSRFYHIVNIGYLAMCGNKTVPPFFFYFSESVQMEPNGPVRVHVFPFVRSQEMLNMDGIPL